MIEPGSFTDVKDMQACAYKHLLSSRFQPDLRLLVHTRLSKMFAPYETNMQSLDLDCAFKIMRSMRAHDSIRILKTWTNAWCTSSRFHDDIMHPCYFGCEAKDSMSHYVNCPTLFAVLSFMCEGVTHLHDTVSSDPLQRLGVVNPNLWKLKVVA